MKKDAQHISVNTVRATFLRHKEMVSHTYVRSSRPEFSVMQLSRTFSEIPVEES